MFDRADIVRDVREPAALLRHSKAHSLYAYVIQIIFLDDIVR